MISPVHSEKKLPDIKPLSTLPDKKEEEVHLVNVDFRYAMPTAGYAYAQIYEDVLLVDNNIS